MENTSFRLLIVSAALAALPTAVFAKEPLPEPAPKFVKILYSATFPWKKAILRFQLGTVRREEAGRSRIMATISGPRGVLEVCERNLTRGLVTDLDFIPLLCSGSLSVQTAAPATFVFPNSLPRPIFRISTGPTTFEEVTLRVAPEPASVLAGR